MTTIIKYKINLLIMTQTMQYNKKWVQIKSFIIIMIKKLMFLSWFKISKSNGFKLTPLLL